MKKAIDFSTFKKRYRRDPVYTPREQIALDNPDCIVLRVLIDGEWKSREQAPLLNKTLLETLEFIQAQLRHSPDTRGICLYVGGKNPKTGERMIAAVPHDWIPENIRRVLSRPVRAK